MGVHVDDIALIARNTHALREILTVIEISWFEMNMDKNIFKMEVDRSANIIKIFH